jgi:hypothetical protein
MAQSVEFVTNKLESLDINLQADVQSIRSCFLEDGIALSNTQIRRLAFKHRFICAKCGHVYPSQSLLKTHVKNRDHSYDLQELKRDKEELVQRFIDEGHQVEVFYDLNELVLGAEEGKIQVGQELIASYDATLSKQYTMKNLFNKNKK